METNDLNRDELFEEVKDKCKSLVKRDLYSWLICGIVVILLLFDGLRVGAPKSMLSTICLIAIVCLGGLSMMFDYWFLKKVDKLDTPDRLLYYFEKKHRFNLIVLFVSFILFLGIIFVKSGVDFWIIVVIPIIVEIAFYNSGGPRTWYRKKEQVIIEQLRRLIEQKNK